MEELKAIQEEPQELDLGEAQSSFAEELVLQPGCDTLPRCFQCGVCTGTCPVSEVDERFSPARIIQWIRMGLVDQVLSSPAIWYCLQCHRCSFHCPQGVRFADIDEALRHRAVEDGYIDGDRVEALGKLELQLRHQRIRLLDRVFSGDASSNLCLEPEPAAESGKEGEAAGPEEEQPQRQAEESPRALAAPSEPKEEQQGPAVADEAPAEDPAQDIEWETEDDGDEPGFDSW